jgi:hypothetical protein
MPFPGETFLDRIRSTLGTVSAEFEHLYAQLEGYLRTEHKDDGSHGDLTADSVTVAGDVSGEAASFSDDGPHTFGDITLHGNATAPYVQLGSDANDGWRIVKEAQTGIDTSGNALKVYDRDVDPSLPVVQLSHYTSGGYFYLRPYTGSGGLALGHKDGNSSDRIKYLAVQDGIFEVGRGTAAGYWTSYTPTWAAIGGTQPAIGDGTLTGEYSRVGSTVLYRITLVAGSTTTFGSGGSWTFSLPVTSVSYDAITPLATVNTLDTSTSTFAPGIATAQSTSTILPRLGASGIVITNALPWTWANGDKVSLMGTYQAA